MDTNLQTRQEPSAVAALMQAVESKDPRMLELLLNAREKWQADESRGLFNAAVVKFQQRVAIIAKLDKAYDKLYARMDRIWREIRPLLDECGLAVTWESVKTTDGGCVLDGHLRHIAGHAQPLHHEMPMPDLLKGQNAAQRAGSAETYAKRYALMAALGIQVGEDNDGAGAPSKPAGAKRIAEVRAMMAKVGRTEEAACKFLNVASLESANADQIEQLYGALRVRQSAPAQSDAGAHVPTRAESLAIIDAAKAVPRDAALKSRDLTIDNYRAAPDAILAEVAAMLGKGAA